MTYIKTSMVKGQRYYQEVEAYRDDNGKKHHRIIRHLGKELPKELNGVPLGFLGAKLFIDKRVQMRITKLGLEEFIDQVGTIRKISKGKAGVEFDIAIKGRKEWTVNLEWLGNIPREQINEN